MFTLEQIKRAHSKVKNGSDFPAYIHELKSIGLLSYTQFVSDGQTEYFGEHTFSIQSEAKYNEHVISEQSNIEKLKHDLKIHQHGGTNYLVFCEQAAEAGVEKWTIDMVKMTCTYYDKAGTILLAEVIPE